jgi:hypothetical protein
VPRTHRPLDNWMPDSGLPTPDDGHKMPAIEVSEDEVECAFLGPDGITPAKFL